jgi:hypothetical protein
MASDEETGTGKPLDVEKDVVQSSQETSGILSRFRQMEANLDAKFGVESEAIDRKLPEDRRPVKWHEELSMALLWASATMNTSVSDFQSNLHFSRILEYMSPIYAEIILWKRLILAGHSQITLRMAITDRKYRSVSLPAS